MKKQWDKMIMRWSNNKLEKMTKPGLVTILLHYIL